MLAPVVITEKPTSFYIQQQQKSQQVHKEEEGNTPTTTKMMSVRAVSTTCLTSATTSDFKKHSKRPFGRPCLPPPRILCSAATPDLSVTIEKLEGNDNTLTGGAYDFSRATISLTQIPLSVPKKVTLLRHGLSTWNEESRVQGSSNLSVLTETGVKQAEKCKMAFADMYFDQCFSSPISRAKSTAEIIWQGREQPLTFLDSLKEAHLFFLEGMKNVDAKQKYPKEYTTWREDPSKFHINGVYPLSVLWKEAREAWKEILLAEGENFLVVTHKSMLRALICTALGLAPERFRAFEVNNGGVTVFKFNRQGEPMLHSLNMTEHMYNHHTYHY